MLVPKRVSSFVCLLYCIIVGPEKGQGRPQGDCMHVCQGVRKGTACTSARAPARGRPYPARVIHVALRCWEKTNGFIWLTVISGAYIIVQ